MQELLLVVYGIVLFALSLYGFHGAYLAYWYYRLRHQKRLIRSVCRLRYPREKLEIQVLDDSTDDTRLIARRLVQEYRQQGINIVYYHRSHREGFKAGALKEGLAKARGEFIAIFDADFVPHPDFLLRTLPYFQLDHRIAMVQTRWTHLNADYSLLTRIQSLILDYHFGIEQLVRSRSGANAGMAVSLSAAYYDASRAASGCTIVQSTTVSMGERVDRGSPKVDSKIAASAAAVECQMAGDYASQLQRGVSTSAIDCNAVFPSCYVEKSISCLRSNLYVLCCFYLCCS